MKLIPSHESFGAVIHGFNLNSISEEQKTTLHEWLNKYKVLSFLDQDLSLEEFENFGSIFGSLSDMQNIYNDSMNESHPILVTKYVTSLTRDTNIENKRIFGDVWHSDFAGIKCPPAYTILYADEVPIKGGDTLFINQVKSFDECDIKLKEKIKTLNGLFESGVYKQNYNIHNESVQSLHSLVKVHPNTNEHFIFNSPGHFKKIYGLNSIEGNKLAAELYNHVTQESYIYRLKWIPKMITIWDNRCTIHKSTKSESPQKRIMYRIQVND